MRRIGDEKTEDRSLILSTSGIDPDVTTTLHEGDGRSERCLRHGCDLEETNVTKPDKIENLIDRLALTFR